MKNRGISKRITALVLVFVFAFAMGAQALAAGLGAWRGGSPEGNATLLEQLTETAASGVSSDELQAKLQELDVLDENGEIQLLEQFSVNGEMMTLAEARALLEAPNADLSAPIEVDGISATLGDLKTMLEIEDELARIKETYFSGGAATTPEHDASRESLLGQLAEEGLEVEPQAEGWYLKVEYLKPAESIWKPAYDQDAEGNLLLSQADIESAIVNMEASPYYPVDIRVRLVDKEGKDVPASAYADKSNGSTLATVQCRFLDGSAQRDVHYKLPGLQEEDDTVTLEIVKGAGNAVSEPFRIRWFVPELLADTADALKTSAMRWQGTQTMSLQFFGAKGALLLDPKGSGGSTYQSRLIQCESTYDWTSLAVESLNETYKTDGVTVADQYKNYNGVADFSGTSLPVYYYQYLHNTTNTLYTTSGSHPSTDTKTDMLITDWGTVVRLNDAFAQMMIDGIYVPATDQGINTESNVGYTVDVDVGISLGKRTSLTPAKQVLSAGLVMGRIPSYGSGYNTSSALTANRDVAEDYPTNPIDIPVLQHYDEWKARLTFPSETDDSPKSGPVGSGTATGAFSILYNENNYVVDAIDTFVPFLQLDKAFKYANNHYVRSLVRLNDATPPTIKSVSTPRGTFAGGQKVPIIVEFSEPVRLGYTAGGTTGLQARLKANASAETGHALTLAENPATIARCATFLYTVPQGTSASLNGAVLELLGSNGVPITAANAGPCDITNNPMAELNLNEAKYKVNLTVAQDWRAAFTRLAVQQTDEQPGDATGQTLTTEYVPGSREKARAVLTVDPTLHRELAVDKDEVANGKLLEMKLCADVNGTKTVYDLISMGTGDDQGRWYGVEIDLKTIAVYGAVVGDYSSMEFWLEYDREPFILENNAPSRVTVNVPVAKYEDACWEAETAAIDGTAYPLRPAAGGGYQGFNITLVVTPGTANPVLEWEGTPAGLAKIDTISKEDYADRVRYTVHVTPLKATGPNTPVSILPKLDGHAPAGLSPLRFTFEVPDGDALYFPDYLLGRATHYAGVDWAVSWANPQAAPEGTVQSYQVSLYDTTAILAKTKPVYQQKTSDTKLTIPGSYFAILPDGRKYTLAVSASAVAGLPQVGEARLEITVQDVPRYTRVKLAPMAGGKTAFMDQPGLEIPLSWQLEDYTADAGGSFEMTVAKNGAVIDTINNPAQTAYNLRPASVTDGLMDEYTVSLSACGTADPEGYTATDTVTLRVYSSGFLKLMVGSAYAQKSLELENLFGGGNAEFEQILSLRLAKEVSVDTHGGAMGTISDGIRWTSEDPTVASPHYKSVDALQYHGVENLSSQVFSPYTKFMLVGNSDGKTTVRVTHEASGVSSELEVDVATLRNKLYLFKVLPAQTTTVQYTRNAPGAPNGVETATTTTDASGLLWLYEPEGITGAVRFKSTVEEVTYTGAITEKDLVSGEGRGSHFESFQVNGLELKPASKLEVYAKNPDGTAYENWKETTLKGMVEVTTPGGQPQPLDLSGNWEPGEKPGQLLVQFSEADVGELAIGSDITFVFEITPAEADKDKYRPKLVLHSSKVGYNTKKSFGSITGFFSEITDDDRGKPYIALQRLDLGEEGAIPYEVTGTDSHVGPSLAAPEPVLETIVSWWGTGTNPTNLSVVAETGEAKAINKARQTSVTLSQRYSFGENHYLVNTVPLTDAGLKEVGIGDGGEGRLVLAAYDSGKKMVARVNAQVALANTTNVHEPLKDEEFLGDTETMLQNVLDADSVRPDGVNTRDSTINLLLKASGGMQVGVPNMNVTIVPTANPMVYKAVAYYGAGVGNDNGAKNITYEQGDFSMELNTTPSFTELLDLVNPETYVEAVSPIAIDWGGSIAGLFELEIRYDTAERAWRAVVVGGGVDVKANGGATLNLNLTGVLMFPITLSLQNNLSMEYNLRALRPQEVPEDSTTPAALTNDFYNSIRISYYRSAFAGMGFDYNIVALKVGILSTIGIDFQGHFLNRPYLTENSKLKGFDVNLNGSVGLQFVAKLLSISIKATWETFRFNEELYTTGDVAAIKAWLEEQDAEILGISAEGDMIVGVPRVSTLGFESRSYLGENAVAAMEEVAPAEAGTATDIAYQPLSLAEAVAAYGGEDGVSGEVGDGEVQAAAEVSTFGGTRYPFANPFVTRDGAVITYLSDQNSPNLNQTRAMWMTTGGARAISESVGFADSALALDGNGSWAAAAWVRQRDTLPTTADSAGVLKMMNDSEVYASVYTGGTWVTTRLTENTTPDLAPIVAANAGKALVAWRAPTGSGLSADQKSMQYDDCTDSLWFSVYDGEGWSEHQLLYSAVAKVGNVKGLHSAILDANHAAIVYAVDAGGTGNPTAYEIRMATINLADGSVTSNVRLTENQRIDENPQLTLVELDDKTYYLAGWSTQHDTGLTDIAFHVADENGQPYTGFLPSLAMDNPNATFPSAFTFVRSEDAELGNLHVVYAVNSEEGSSVMAVRFTGDAETGIYPTAPFEAAKSSLGAADHVAASLNGDTLNCIFQNTVYGQSGSMNSAMKLGGAIQNATSFQYAVSQVNPAGLVPGQLLQIPFTIYNDGSKTITKARVEFDANNIFYFDSLDIRPGTSQILTVNYNLPDPIKNLYYAVVVTFGTSSKSAQGRLDIAFPDLAVEEMTLLASGKGTRTMELHLVNKSATPVTAIMPVAVNLATRADGDYRAVAYLTAEEVELLNQGKLYKQLTYYVGSGGIPIDGQPLYANILFSNPNYREKEYDAENNQRSLLLSNAVAENGGEIVRVEVDHQQMENNETTALVTATNLSMQQLPAGRLYVELVDDTGKKIDSRYIDVDGIGPEDTFSDTVTFGAEGHRITGRYLMDGQMRPKTPVLTQNLSFGDYIYQGSQMALMVEAEAVPAGHLTYQWYKDGKVIRGATGTSYTIKNATEASAGRYYVVVTNTLGNLTDSTTSNTFVLRYYALASSTLSLTKNHILLRQGEYAEIPFTTTRSPRLAYTVEPLSGRDSLSAELDILLEEDRLWITAKSGATASATVRLFDQDNSEASQEIRVDILTGSTSPPPYEQRKLTQTSVTVNLHMEDGPVIELYRDGSAGGSPWAMLNGAYTVEMVSAGKGQDAAFAQLTKVYKTELELVSETALALKLQDEISDGRAASTRLKNSSYKVKLVLKLKANGQTVEENVFPDTLTLRINRKLPTLKAAAVKFNTFFGNESVDFTMEGYNITGGKVTALWLNGEKAKQNKSLIGEDGWLDLATRPDGDIGAMSPARGLTARRNGTLHVLAKVEGWREPVPVRMAVSAANTPPAVRLAKSKVSLYAVADKSLGTPVQVVPKTKSVAIEDTRVTGLRIATPQEMADLVAEKRLTQKQVDTTYKLNDPTYGYLLKYDGAPGCYRLHMESGKTAESGKLLLLADTWQGGVNPTPGKLLLPLTVKVVPEGKVMTLKPAKGTVALNPALEESYEFKFTPSIADYDPVGTVLHVERVSGSNEIPLPVLSGSYAVKVTMEAGTPYNASAKFKVTMRDSEDRPIASGNIVVKTQKKAAEPTVSLKVRGSLDLTTGKAATVTVKISNFQGSYNSGNRLAPKFAIYTKAGELVYDQTAPEGSALQQGFEVTRTSVSTWSVRLAEGGILAPGSYKIGVKSGNVSGTRHTLVTPPKQVKGQPVPHGNYTSLTVKASKPKLAKSQSAFTLYRADALDERQVVLTLPAGVAEIESITLKDAGKDNMFFEVADLGGGKVAIGFRADAAEYATRARTRTLTLNIFLAGNSGIDKAGAPAATLTTTVKVTVK